MAFISFFLFEIFILIVICCSGCYNAQETPNKHSNSMPAISAVLLESPKDFKDKSHEPQLMISIRVNPSFDIKKVETFLILDEVYHPHKRLKAKIMAPYLIEISRGEPVMMYPLQFTKSVQVGNGVVEPQSHNEPEHKNDKIKQSDDKVKIISHNSSNSTTTPFGDRRNSPKKETVNKVMQKVYDNKIKIGSRTKSQKAKASWGQDILETPINMKTRIQSDNFEFADQRNPMQLPLRYKNKMFPYQMADNTNKNIHAFPFGTKINPYQKGSARSEVTANVGVEGNLTNHLQNQLNFGQLGQMKMLLRNETSSPKNNVIKEVSNYYAPDSISETSANNYMNMNSNDQYDTKLLRKYPLLTASDFKPQLHKADDSDMYIDKSSNIGRVPSIKRYLFNSNEGHLKPSKFSNSYLKRDHMYPSADINDQQRQFYSTNFSPAFSQETPYQNSVFDSLSSETNKNHKNINRAMDEDDKLYYAMKGEFQNKMRKNFDSSIKQSFKNVNNYFQLDPTISQISDTKNVPNSDFQYRSDLNIVKPLDKSISDNRLTYIMQESLSPQLSLDSRQERTKQKRSYLFYDDMEMTGNLDNNEDIYEHLSPVQSFANTANADFSDGVQPCTTCGGKAKKPPGKGASDNPSTDSRINNCNCRSKRIKCSCVPQNITQSVGEACYSVFKMNSPLPFLTTKMRIFQKRRGTWWKIAPSISLNSLSGIFANENLSILFSSHVDIFQLEKSLRLQNHQLFIPKENRPTREDKHQPHNNIGINRQRSNTDIEHFENLNLNPETILAINSTTPKLITNFLEFHGGFTKSPRIIRNIDDNTEQASVRKIGELGYFPTSMNMLERCPNNINRICLNMLDDIVPAFTIKVRMPFRENVVVFSNVFKVMITKVISDTTTKDALQISVDLINKGIESREFSISVNNCPTACATAAKTSVQKLLLPHIGETINFLLPLIVQTNNLKQTKFHCEVVIKTIISNDAHSDSPKKNEEPQDRLKRTESYSSKIVTKQEKEVVVAVRQLTIEPGNRCLCVWKCRCHCVPKLETYVDFNICQELDINSESTAGFLLNSSNVENNGEDNPETAEQNYSDSNQHFQYNGGFLWNALLLLLLMILIGLLKAIFGICVTSVDKCGYDYMQPGRTYSDSSNCRHFWVNTFFFIIFPFVFWCKCFTPSADDLLVASTEWTCHSYRTGTAKKDQNTYKCLCTDEEEDEDVIFAHHIQDESLTNKIQCHLNDKCPSNYRQNYQTFYDPDKDDNVTLLKNEKQKSSKNIIGSRLEGGENIKNSIYDMYDFELALNDDIFDDDDEVNTKFILKALAESRESLKQLQIHNQSISLESITEENNSIRNSAEELVQKLNAVQIVYRTFDRPIGNLKNIPSCFKYCIQGYFLPSIGIGYEFVNYNPLAQHRCVSMDGKTIQVLRPPNLLCPKDFSRRYVDKYEVLNVGDLTEHPPEHVPCINISALAAVATSMAKLASDQSSKHNVITTSTSPRSKLDLHDSSPCRTMDNKIFEAETELYATHSFPLKDIEETYLISTIEPLDHDLLQSDEAVNISNE